MIEQLRRGFRLGELTIHPLTGRISGPQGTQHVSPATMDVLVCLAQHPDKVVSRDQLIDEVWNGATAGDSNLTRSVADLRHKLHDHEDNPRYIQTLPRRGFRLLAAVSALDPQPEQKAEPLATPSGPASNGDRPAYREFFEELRRRRVIRVGLVYLVASWVIIQVAQTMFPALLLPDWTVTLVVVLMVFGFPVALILAWAYQVEPDGKSHSATTVHYVVNKNRKIDFAIIAALIGIVIILAFELYVREVTTVPQVEIAQATPELPVPTAIETGRPSIAVLAFRDMTADQQNQYFGDGLAEEILNLLVRVKEVDVAARTSSFYFKNKDVDIKTIASHLAVTNVLEGSVRRQDDTIRITAQLINAETGFHLWSETYDREFERIFDIQDDIARQVVKALEIVLSNDSNELLERVPTQNLAAYEFYLQGRDKMRGEFEETQLENALSLFNRAIDLDRNFAEAYAGLCETFLELYERSRSVDYFERAERACHRGLTLDANAGAVYTGLGHLYRMSGQYEDAETEFNQAIALNNRDVNAYNGLAETYKQQNRLEEAERMHQRVIDLEPGYWRGHLQMGRFLYHTGRIQEAIREFNHVIELDPENATGYLNLGSAYYLLDDFENAATEWRRSLAIVPSATAYMNVGSSYFFLGRFDEAAEMYRQAAAITPDDFELWGSLGDAYRYAGNSDDLAVEAYRKAIELGEKQLGINPASAPTMAPLAQYYANSGDELKSIQLITQAEELEPQDMYVRYFSATTHASLNDIDAAIAAVEKAIEFGYPRNLLELDAGLASLASDDRFQALMQNDDD